MIWATPLVVTALVLGAPDAKNPSLFEGMQRYEALDYPGALQALTRALDLPSSRRDLARIHLYIGLIQHRYKLSQDAEASFTKALDYDSKIRAPKTTTKGAKALFRKILRATVGEAADLPEARAEDAKRRRLKLPPAPRPKEEVAPSPTARLAESSTASVSYEGSAMGETGRPPPEDRDREPALAEEAGAGLGPAASDPLRQLDDSPRSARESAFLLPPAEGSVEHLDSNGPFVGWIAVGVGVAAVATGVTFGALSGKNASAANAEPVAKRAEELFDTAVQQRTLALVSFGVSGVSLGLAAALFLME